MSEENVRIVQAGIEAYNAQNWDALREMHAPSVIARTIEGWPEPGPFVGRDAVMRQFARVRAAWDTDAIEPIGDFLDAGDRVIVRVFFHDLGIGPEANLEFTIVYTVRERRIFFIEYFWDHAEALEAAGLSE
jgi:ketosteroid isomerase-like protein